MLSLIQVIYAWARNADPLKLPEDVGFKVGVNTETEYLVLQVHYSKKFPGLLVTPQEVYVKQLFIVLDNEYDNSGTYLLYTETP